MISAHLLGQLACGECLSQLDNRPLLQRLAVHCGGRSCDQAEGAMAPLLSRARAACAVLPLICPCKCKLVEAYHAPVPYRDPSLIRRDFGTTTPPTLLLL